MTEDVKIELPKRSNYGMGSIFNFVYNYGWFYLNAKSRHAGFRKRFERMEGTL